jgi:hypothetical protein
MNEAKKLTYQQPEFMAVKDEHQGGEDTGWMHGKKLRVNSAVLLTWIVVILLTIIFWYLISKLF